MIKQLFDYGVAFMKDIVFTKEFICDCNDCLDF